MEINSGKPFCSSVGLLNRLLTELAAMDGCLAPSLSVAIEDSLFQRMCYVFLLYPESLRDGLRAEEGSATDEKREASLLAFQEIRTFLDRLELVLSIFDKHLAKPGHVLSPCARVSEICRLPRWQRLDGADPIELVVQVERKTGHRLKDCPWWEFPVLELSQALCMNQGEYDPIAHRKKIVGVMHWQSVDGYINDDDREGHTLAEIVSILCGISFEECGPNSVLASSLKSRSTPSRYYDLGYRMAGVCEVLDVLFEATTRKRRKLIRSRIWASAKEDESIRDSWLGLRRTLDNL